MPASRDCCSRERRRGASRPLPVECVPHTIERLFMPNFTRDPILLTPGPLTTSLQTKAAMLRDWGSWDSHFNSVTRDVREKLLGVIEADSVHACVPMQGS